MEIKFDPDDELTLNKTIEIPSMTIVARAIFYKNKYYWTFFLDEWLCRLETKKKKRFYILLVFVLITSTLLIAVSTYCFLMKYKAKQKHLLPFYITNNKLIII